MRPTGLTIRTGPCYADKSVRAITGLAAWGVAALDRGREVIPLAPASEPRDERHNPRPGRVSFAAPALGRAQGLIDRPGRDRS